MSSQSFENALQDLVNHLHSRDRLRVWSIIITIFGDAVLPRGGKVWLGTLLDICDGMNIEAGSVRAAMSRLASDGWVERTRLGRKSYYQLAEAGLNEFSIASKKIYAPADKDWQGDWSILIVSDAAGEARDARRKYLRNLGFGSLSPTIFIRPETSNSQSLPDVRKGDFLFTSRLQAPSDQTMLAKGAWNLDGLADDYQAFHQRYLPLHQAASDGAVAPGIEVMVARSLLIHDFRKLVLRDPMLPASILGGDWVGNKVREMVADLYHLLLNPSEEWLCSQVEENERGLNNLDESITKRFRE